MLLFDLLGAVLTLLTVALLGLGGYLLALLVLGLETARRDRLALAISTLLAATAEAVGIGLLLGGLGLLRIGNALALQGALTVALLLHVRRVLPGDESLQPAAEIGRRLWAACREHPFLALLAAHAAGSELLRGLLRPPLSWDSLMYHLLLSGTWLRSGNLDPVLGNIPVSYYGYVPANGSVWFWWWLAPSHSELYVNLSSLPHWLLLGVATAGLARELGARRHGLLAAFLVLLTPTVLRFVAAEYVDLFAGSLVVAATFFLLRWLREASWADALSAGSAMGLAAGSKVLAVVYVGALAAAALLVARGSWRRRSAQVAAALALTCLLGSFFYVRNLRLGTEALATTCLKTASGHDYDDSRTIPRRTSVLGQPDVMFGQGQLRDTFLGITRPQSLELGVGPQALLMLLGLLVVPLAMGRDQWRAALLVGGQIWAELTFWLTVPFAANLHVFANVRYLISGIGLLCAAAVAVAERRRIEERWVQAIVWVLAIQGMLQLHAEMPTGVRLSLAWLDLALVVLAVSPALRGWAWSRRRSLVAAAVVIGVLAAPALGRFRADDRGRAFESEYTAHTTSARLFAAGWSWLDAHAGTDTVAAVGAPNSYFLYPVMGPRLERDLVYVNINAADHPLAHQYPECEPRVDPSPDAWIANLATHRVRWVYGSRYPEFDFPVELGWARVRPDLFVLRFEDRTNLVFEYLPNAGVSR